MRTALPLLAAALLGACAVDVDGAPCAVPGTTADCPGGQACGNDLRCSARALACVATRCTPGEGDACVDAAGLPSTAIARWCDARDPVCGVRVADPCAARGYACGTRSGGARCECPATDTRELAVVPDGGPAKALPYATGASSPPGCAFATLTDAIARAAALRPDPSAVVTVTASGVPPGSTRTFSEATGEMFALAVARGIVLRSDASSGGGRYEIVREQPGSSTLVLEAGGALEGFTVRSATGAVDGQVVLHLCAGHSEPASASAVEIDGRAGAAAAVGAGLRGIIGCPLSLTGVQVRNAGVGIWWQPDVTAQLTMIGGSVTGCGRGIAVDAGRLLLDGVRVAGNAGRGVDAAFGAALEIRGSSIVQNGDTGIASSDSLEVRVSGATIWGNGATTRWTGPASGIGRRAGGIVLSGTPPASSALELWGNRVYGNGGDQLLVVGPTSASWVLTQQTTCVGPAGPVANLIGCYDPIPAGTTADAAARSRGVVAIDASASAPSQWWLAGTPSTDDAVRLPAGTVVVSPSCTWSTPTLDCGSEAPPP